MVREEFEDSQHPRPTTSHFRHVSLAVFSFSFYVFKCPKYEFFEKYFIFLSYIQDFISFQLRQYGPGRMRSLPSEVID